MTYIVFVYILKTTVSAVSERYSWLVKTCIFVSKIGPQFDNKVGHVYTNNGLANAKRYRREHSEQGRASVGVFCSSRLGVSTEFCALIILPTEATLD